MPWLNGYGPGGNKHVSFGGCLYREATDLPWNKSAPSGSCCKIVHCRHPEAVADPKKLGPETGLHARIATSDDYFGEIIQADYCNVRSGYCNQKSCALWTESNKEKPQ